MKMRLKKNVGFFRHRYPVTMADDNTRIAKDCVCHGGISVSS